MSTTPLPPPMSDADREAVFRSLPDMLEGFLKTWGWLHFAKGIEAVRDAQWQAYATAARADLEAENARLRHALEFVARHKSSDWPERCQQMVDMARAVLKEQP